MHPSFSANSAPSLGVIVRKSSDVNKGKLYMAKGRNFGPVLIGITNNVTIRVQISAIQVNQYANVHNNI